jgi:(1->4)-alpha-D-glucan 1-alpha-D-glucosylmutase
MCALLAPGQSGAAPEIHYRNDRYSPLDALKPIRATYRLQLEPDFDFDKAAAVVPYLAALGVSHVYCSPVFESVPGSRHGYDVVDPTRVRAELGGAEGRARFVAAVREHGLGLIADIVPNHVALEGNAWWIDVLTHGTASAAFPVFDVDLNADPYAGPAPPKLMIPILGEPYGRELTAGRLRLVVERGKPFVAYAVNRFPLSITSRAALDDEPEGRGEQDDQARLEAIVTALNADAKRLHALLEVQHYRLTWWRLARDESPYRRFFDVNGLIGVRVEDDTVFDAMHRLVAEWVADGSIDGLRVDHVDGLADPGAYLRRLRTLAPTQWIGVEKILGEDETLPRWPIDGTTGYETGALLTRLLTAAEGEGPLTALYHRFAGAIDNFDEVEEDARHEILEHWLAGDAKRVALALHRMCQDDLDLRDYSLRDASIVIRELVAGARVYRTYVSTEGATDADVTRLAALCQRVRQRRPDIPEPLIDLVARLFATGGDGPNGLEFVRRFQQLSTATAAKAVEDTAAYRDVHYLALNDVGCDPRRFSVAPGEFHDTVARWQRERPLTMHNTSTHDSKRGEDVRARLSVLSEIPERWTETIERWGRRSDSWRVDGQPDRNLEYYLYQTLVGAWPLTRERAHVHIEKAAREAKVFTDWLNPSEEYERAMHHFVDDLFDDAGFIGEVAAFVDTLHPADWIKGLSQQLLKLTIPGVPDLYQGSELWHRALVDPDNRRLVDYACRQKSLEACDRMDPAAVLARMDEGLPKLWTTSRTLRLKARHLALADPASAFAPLEIRGPAAARAIGFLRGGDVAVVVPIRAWAPNWADTHLRLPDGRWHHVLADIMIDGGAVDLAALFSAFPVALLERRTDQT